MSSLGFANRPVDISFSIPAYFLPLSALSICLFGVARLKWKETTFEPLNYVVRSPLKTVLPHLSKEQKDGLPYPPDLFSGRRDVQTPWGSLRVYEWGPEHGRRVLLVHGISTPCLSLGRVAEILAQNGCRVMLFDLFGRGYSDNPQDLHHDSRLYITQILLAIASSSVPWTGTNGFSIIGYSLGGGIAASFTNTFPNLVASLTLIGPGGIVKGRQVAWSSKFLYQTESILPQWSIEYLMRRMLWSSTMSSPPQPGDRLKATTATAAELGNEASLLLYKNHPQVDATSAVQWQLENHPGFVPAYISAIRHAPITHQHEAWRRIGQRQATLRNVIKSAPQIEAINKAVISAALVPGKVLLILGRNDPIIKPEEVGVDAEKCFGKDNLATVIIDGGHEIPMSHADEVASAILWHWTERVVPEELAEPFGRLHKLMDAQQEDLR